jgi:hypothetical protein
MAERHRALTAEQRLAERQRDQARLRRARLQRELTGPLWNLMTRLVPILFVRQGTLACHVLTAPTEKILDALRLDAVFTLDTAMRIAHDAGIFPGGDIHAYTTSTDLPERLAAAGLIASTPCPDTTLVRPWPGPPRLFLAVVEEFPPSREIRGAFRAVEADRLRRELLGAVGPRADLFALLERLERRT